MKKRFLFGLIILFSAFVFNIGCSKPKEEPVLLAQNKPPKVIDNSFSNAGNRCVNTQKGDAIVWSGHKQLAWADFKAKEKGTPGFAVGTVSSNFGYTIASNNAKSPNGAVYVRFYCTESWVNPNFNNKRILDQVLAHEQVHFDIAELYGRKFNKGIQDLKISKNFNTESLRSLYKRLQNEFDDYQDRYDKETGHSTNGDMQRHWFKQMGEDLLALDAYKDYGEF